MDTFLLGVLVEYPYIINRINNKTKGKNMACKNEKCMCEDCTCDPCECYTEPVEEGVNT